MLAQAQRAEPQPDSALAELIAALARVRPACTVYAVSHSEHVLQIYAGLYALHEAGCIRVRQRFGAHELQRRLAARGDDPVLSKTLNGLFVEIEGVGLVFFDVRDGANYYPHILERLVLYAKRSFRRSLYAEQPEKFVALGLNYSIYLDRTSALEFARAVHQLDGTALTAKRLLISLARVVPGIGRLLGVPTVASLSCLADAGVPAKAIFLARTWDPAEVASHPAAIIALNDFRAACIRTLRRHFGGRFCGGFARSRHALRNYPDCVVEKSFRTRRRDYLRGLRSYPVCVATTGLYDSIGWKFAEYMALAKAIVSEPIRFELPGPVAAGANYLEFTTAESCAAKVAALFDDVDARARMMERNLRYYLEYGTPQALLARVIHAALPSERPRSAIKGRA